MCRSAVVAMPVSSCSVGVARTRAAGTTLSVGLGAAPSSLSFSSAVRRSMKATTSSISSGMSIERRLISGDGFPHGTATSVGVDRLGYRVVPHDNTAISPRVSKAAQRDGSRPVPLILDVDRLGHRGSFLMLGPCAAHRCR